MLLIVTQLTEWLLTLDRVHTQSWGGNENNLFFVLFYKTLLQHKAEQNCVHWEKNKRSVVKKKNADWIAIIGMKSHTCAGFIDFIKVNVVLRSWKTKYLERLQQTLNMGPQGSSTVFKKEPQRQQGFVFWVFFCFLVRIIRSWCGKLQLLH